MLPTDSEGHKKSSKQKTSNEGTNYDEDEFDQVDNHNIDGEVDIQQAI